MPFEGRRRNPRIGSMLNNCLFLFFLFFFFFLLLVLPKYKDELEEICRDSLWSRFEFGCGGGVINQKRQGKNG
jgi:hypothetical protein